IERHAVDRQDLAGAISEGDRQVANRKKRFGRVHRKVFLGSKASRTASPIIIRSESVKAMLKNPENPSRSACKCAFPYDSRSPREGGAVRSTKPRKSSAVSGMTEDDRMNGRKVMVATIAFGSKWRKMMTMFETPRARAAWIYSKLRPRRNSARTRPTSETQE